MVCAILPGESVIFKKTKYFSSGKLSKCTLPSYSFDKNFLLLNHQLHTHRGRAFAFETGGGVVRRCNERRETFFPNDKQRTWAAPRSPHSSLTRVSKGSFHRILESFPPFRKRGETIGERGDDASIETKGLFLFGYVSSSYDPPLLTRFLQYSRLCAPAYADQRTRRASHFFFGQVFRHFFFLLHLSFSYEPKDENLRRRISLDFIFYAKNFLFFGFSYFCIFTKNNDRREEKKKEKKKESREIGSVRVKQNWDRIEFTRYSLESLRSSIRGREQS